MADADAAEEEEEGGEVEGEDTFRAGTGAGLQNAMTSSRERTSAEAKGNCRKFPSVFSSRFLVKKQ